MTRTPVESSSLLSIGYDPDQTILEVEFRVAEGKPRSIYQYAGVSAATYEALTQPNVSIGRLFHALVKSDPSVTSSRLEEYGL